MDCREKTLRGQSEGSQGGKGQFTVYDLSRASLVGNTQLWHHPVQYKIFTPSAPDTAFIFVEAEATEVTPPPLKPAAQQKKQRGQSAMEVQAIDGGMQQQWCWKRVTRTLRKRKKKGVGEINTTVTGSELDTRWAQTEALRCGRQPWRKITSPASGAAIDHTGGMWRDTDPRSDKTDSANAIWDRKRQREQAVLTPDVCRQREQPALCLSTVKIRNMTLWKPL